MDRTSWYIENVLTNCQFITNTNLSFAILPYDGKEKESCGQKCSIVFTTYCTSAPCVEVGWCSFLINQCMYWSPGLRSTTEPLPNASLQRGHSQTRGPSGQPKRSSGTAAVQAAVCCRSRCISFHHPEWRSQGAYPAWQRCRAAGSRCSAFSFSAGCCQHRTPEATRGTKHYELTWQWSTVTQDDITNLISRWRLSFPDPLWQLFYLLVLLFFISNPNTFNCWSVFT